MSSNMTSVLQDWVMRLPLREQGALVVGMRGCDDAPKYPLNSTERELTSYLRWCVLVPADMREVGVPGAFFKPTPPHDGWKQSDLGHYPLHWFTHMMHAFEIVGYRHPNRDIAYHAQVIYRKLVYGLHLVPENRETMIERLSEDRIANNSVVS